MSAFCQKVPQAVGQLKEALARTYGKKRLQKIGTKNKELKSHENFFRYRQS
jgi:hypothetical protein